MGWLMDVLLLGGELTATCQTECASGVPREEWAGAGAHQCAMFQGGERLEVLVAFRNLLLVFREQQEILLVPVPFLCRVHRDCAWLLQTCCGPQLLLEIPTPP